MSSTGSQTPARPARSRKQVNHPGMIQPSPDSRRRMGVDFEQPTTSKNKRKEPSGNDTEAESDASVLVQPARKKHRQRADSDTSIISQPARKKDKQRAYSETSTISVQSARKKSKSKSKKPRKKTNIPQATESDEVSFLISYSYY